MWFKLIVLWWREMRVNVELKSIAARLYRPFPSFRITSPINRTRNLWRTKLLRTSAMDGMSGIWDVGNILFYPQAGSPVCTGTVTPPCLRFISMPVKVLERRVSVLVFVNHHDCLQCTFKFVVNPYAPILWKESGTLTDQMVSAKFLQLINGISTERDSTFNWNFKVHQILLSI